MGIIKRGYSLQFARRPPRFSGVVSTSVQGENARVLRSEVMTLLEKGAIEMVSPALSESGFYSRYFLIPKKDNGLRPILDLRRLNHALMRWPFRMITLKQILSQIRTEDWFCSLDLKDAYFHIQIAPHHRRFLRFAFEGVAYQYTVLPFGLSLAHIISRSYYAIISRKSLKEKIGVLMPRRYCGSCRSPLHADDGHSECVSCLGKSHADAVLAGSDCSHCESISLASLRTRIAFFSESDPAPRALPFSSSQEPVRKKQQGRGSQRPVESELTPAQIPRASLSPHREMSPVLFIQTDQRPSASVSDLVSFGGSDDELADDSMSLVASDAEELSGSVTAPAPAPSGLPAPSAAKAGMDAELFRAPRTFTKCMDAALSPLRQMGIRILNYLDDWLILAQSEVELLSHRTLILSHLKRLGLRVNFAKSALSPSQRISFLGTVLDSAHMRAVIAPERALAIQKLAATFKSDTARPLKVFQRMLGLMAAASPVLQLGLLLPFNAG